MPFVDAARATVPKLPTSDPLRIVLEYLLKHGIGSHNAKPWSKIEEELDDHGIKMTQTEFQQTVLKDTRAGDIFIGANDHGRTRGYFLIRERVDAITMRDFYRKRIAAEQANLASLERLIDVEWPPAKA
jgi:hypothetical protein